MFINSALTGPDELCDDHRGECSLAEKVDTKSEKDDQKKKSQSRSTHARDGDDDHGDDGDGEIECDIVRNSEASREKAYEMP